MNSSSIDPLQGAGAAKIVNAGREATYGAGAGVSEGNNTESRTQTLNRIKSQISGGIYSPDLQSLANKLIQGGYLNH